MDRCRAEPDDHGRIGTVRTQPTGTPDRIRAPDESVRWIVTSQAVAAPTLHGDCAVSTRRFESWNLITHEGTDVGMI